jgi:hypothetical protein
VSTELSSGPAQETQAVRVQVVFHVTGERQAQAVAAKMIDRAHEIANLPECECDLDVSVETSALESSLPLEGPGGAPPRARPPRS